MMCECGCGAPTNIVTETASREGVVRGQYRRFLKGHFAKTLIRRSGYKDVVIDGNRRKDHILIAEAAIGRTLPVGAVVHHVDGDSLNNARTNLVICQSQDYHMLLHVRARVVKAGGDPNRDCLCRICWQVKPRDCFHANRNAKTTGRQTWCKPCRKEHDAERHRRRMASNAH